MIEAMLSTLYRAVGTEWMSRIDVCCAFTALLGMLFGASLAKADEVACNQFYERGYRLIEKLGVNWPQEAIHHAGEPLDIVVGSAWDDSTDGYMLVFVATADTLFLSDDGYRDPGIAFAQEWNRFAIDDLRSGERVLRIVPPKAGPFGLSFALVAARIGCEERLLSSVGKKVFQIEEQSPVDGKTACLADTLTDAAAPRVEVTMNTEKGGRIEAGQEIRVSWQLEHDLHKLCGANPFYLMFSFSSGVRFSGDGFVALPPQAPGPYGIAQDRDRTRLVVPLANVAATEGRTISEGSFGFTTHETGEMAVGWSLVEVPRLRERPFFKEDFARRDHDAYRFADQRLQVSVGKPKIYVQDMYSVEQPDSIVHSINGRYTMHVFDGWYRIVDSESGNIILERRGQEPKFSPTSRFLTALFENGYAVEIIDLLATKSVYRSSSSTTRTASVDSINWTEGDSYALIEQDGGSAFEEDLIIVPGLVDGRIHRYSPLLSSGRLDGPPLSVIIDTDQAAIYSMYPWSRTLLDPISLTAASDYLHYQDIDTAELPQDIGLVRTRKTESAPCGSWRIVHGASSGPMTVSYGRVDNPEQSPGCLLLATNIDASHEPVGSKRVVGKEGGAVATPVTQRAAVSLAIAPSKKAEATRRNHIGERIADLVGVSLLSVDTGEGILFSDAVTPGGEEDAYEDRLERWTETQKWRDVGLGRVFDKQELPYDVLHCPEGAEFGINPDHVMYARHWTRGGKSAWIVGSRCFTGSGVGVNNGGLYFITETADGAYRQHLFGSAFEEKGFGERVDPMNRHSSPDSYFRNVAAAFGYINSYDDMYASRLDARHLAFVTPSLHFGVFDLEQGRVKWVGEVSEIGGPVGMVALDASGDNIFVVGENGVISVFKLKDGRKILNGKYLDDELALYDPTGYYIATPEAGHFVYLSFDGLPDRYTASQFKAVLDRPDHVRAILAGTADRLQPPELTAPPSLRMAVKPVSRTGTVEIDISAVSVNQLADITVAVDGKLILQRHASDHSISFVETVTLEGSARWVTAIARDKRGLESVPVTVSVEREDKSPVGRLFALGVGTDQYASPRLPRLAYAASDARTFIEMAGAAADTYYSEAETELMLESEDLAGGILRWIARITATATADDTVMILAAGHGLRDEDGAFYLAGRNTDVDDLAATGASWSKIARALAGVKARVFVFVDACHSGAVEFSGANDGAVASIINRDGRVAVIAASKGRQLSQERSSLRGGVFTTSLARIVGVERQDTDRNRNGALELSEIYGALKREVVTLTDGEQTPWIARNEMAGEIPLF